MIINNKSPLRYPGGKTRACNLLEDILNSHTTVTSFVNIVSPFFGGGSFEFHMQNKYNLKIIANDNFTPLYNFWSTCILDNDRLCNELYKKQGTIQKLDFINFQSKLIDENDKLAQSVMFFTLNRCSFSGSTLSGGFSLEASRKRFTISSIDRIKRLNLCHFYIFNLDFEDFINQNNCSSNLLFLDPPYYLEKRSNLYGVSGSMHKTFDHHRLYKCLLTKKNWFMTYNNCEYIKSLYQGFKIIETNWSYGMNSSKKSSEIVIIG